MIERYRAALQGVYGCDLITTTGSGTAAPTGFIWIAIQVLTDAELDYMVSADARFATLGSVTIIAPKLVFGRWSQVGLGAVPAGPKVLCYRCPI